jgi:plastocyanin
MRAALAALLAAIAVAPPSGAGTLEGTLVLGVEGVRLADLGPIVVYLDAPASPRGEAPARATMRQKGASFSPPFLAVTLGQPVEMPNEDSIFHNAFSFSSPNDFDLGLYPGGESREIVFSHAGPVRIYCSIHESMNATVFVSPTSHRTVIDEHGAFRLEDVPPGDWTLRTWSETLPALEQRVSIGSGTTELELELGATD